jgi:hypothetical protein
MTLLGRLIEWLSRRKPTSDDAGRAPSANRAIKATGNLHCRLHRRALGGGHSSASSARGRTAAWNLSLIERSANSSRGL